MSVKKEAKGRGSVPVEVEVPDNTQSAAERRAAEAEVRALIARFAPAHLRLIGAMRRSLRKRLPTAHELVYEYQNLGAAVISFSPNDHGYEGVLAIRASADGVKLYFNQGKELPDPEKLLQGASQARWINVEGASTLARPAGGELDRRGHCAQSRSIRARRPRVGGHSFDIGPEASAASPRLKHPPPQKLDP